MVSSAAAAAGGAAGGGGAGEGEGQQVREELAGDIAALEAEHHRHQQQEEAEAATEGNAGGDAVDEDAAAVAVRVAWAEEEAAAAEAVAGAGVGFFLEEVSYDYLVPPLSAYELARLGRAVANSSHIRSVHLQLCFVGSPENAVADFLLEILAGGNNGRSRNHPSLRLVNLWNNGLNDKHALSAAWGLGVNTSLDVLNLSCNSISDAGVAAVSRALLENAGSALRQLHLGENIFGVEGCAALRRALESPNCNLETLNLCGNRLGDAAIKEIAEGLAKNTSLTRLSLIGNSVTDEGCEAIADVALCRNMTLRRLFLNDNRITSTGVLHLERVLGAGINCSVEEMPLFNNDAATVDEAVRDKINSLCESNRRCRRRFEAVMGHPASDVHPTSLWPLVLVGFNSKPTLLYRVVLERAAPELFR